ncbi:unnamed protein product [Rangifer tarandus platyrhynchus]|uniref:Uncharacterized protein n=1 Tax=Rangifer tarandus platyrhynchus TaxID=3082113 RepID=A0AC59Z3T0_RANTA
MKKSGAELGQQAQATAAAAGALARAAAARGALRGMRQSPGGRSARGGPGAPAGAWGPALRLPHPARPAPCAALGPRRTPEERGRRFPGGGEAYPGRRLPKKRPPRSGSRVSGSPASAAYMEDPRRQKTKGVRQGESLAFPLALPGAPVVGGDFLGAGGGAGAEDAAAAAAAPRGADSAGEGGTAAAAGPWRAARSRPLLSSAGAAGAPSPGCGWPPGLPVKGCSPRLGCGGWRPRLSLTPPSPRDSPRRGREPPRPPVRPLLALGSFCRRRGLAAPHSGAPGPGARQLGAGGLALVSGSSLRRGERTEHGARLARLARLGDRLLRAPSRRASDCLEKCVLCKALECIWLPDELRGAASCREVAGVCVSGAVLARPPRAGFLRSPEDLRHSASRRGKVTFRADLHAYACGACVFAFLGPVAFCGA